LKLGEPSPTDNDGTRLFRSGLLCRELASRGHFVSYWSSNVIHHSKKLRNGLYAKADNPSMGVQFLQGCSYKKNVGLRRVLHHRQTASDFTMRASKLAAPDL